MATRLKLFTGILIIICILQLVLMAPQESPSLEDNAEAVLKKAEEGLKKLFDDENTKKLIDAATNAFSDLAKGLETQFNQFKEKVDTKT